MKIYNATQYADPQQQFGAILPVVYENLIFGVPTADYPSGFMPNALRGFATANDLICLDIESSANKHTQMCADLLRYVDRMGMAKVGFYGIIGFPWGDRTVLNKGQSFKLWQAKNDAWTDVLQASDVVMPSLYCITTDSTYWQQGARMLIDECKRLAPGKPIIPFVWIKFHNSLPQYDQYIGDDYWRLILKTCQRNADGVAVWDEKWMKDSAGQWVQKPWDAGTWFPILEAFE